MAVFLGPTGSPITDRHYDTLFVRARSALRWDARTPVSAHVLRHAAITNVARLGGYAVAQTFAGHTPPTVTGRYIHATLAEVAAAVAALTGEPTRWQYMVLSVLGAARRRGDADVQRGTAWRTCRARALYAATHALQRAERRICR